MPQTMLVPSIGDVTLGSIYTAAASPTTATMLGIAGRGDLYINTTVGAVALYICTAVTSTAVTWTQITIP